MKKKYLQVFIWIMIYAGTNATAQSTFTTGIAGSSGTVCGVATLTATATGDVWVQKASFPPGGYTNAPAFVIGNNGYISTGIAATQPWNNFLFEYNPLIDSWTQRPNFGGMPRSSAAGFSIGTKGYIGTGNTSGGFLNNDFWEYDQMSNAWTQKANVGGPPRSEATGLSVGNKGYIGLGSIMGPFGTILTNDFWEYDPATNAWIQKANYGGMVGASAVGFSIGNKCYIGTGTTTSTQTYRNDFWEYDPATNAWTQKANFAGGNRAVSVGFSIGSKGYIGTGFGPGPNFIYNDFWEYNPITNNWVQRAGFPGSPRRGASGFGIGCKGYLGLGGTTNNVFESDFWEYSPALTYAWSNGVTTQVMTTTVSGVYTVTVTNITGCSAAATVSVNVIPTTSIALTSVSNQTICLPGSPVIITPSGATNYTLNPGNVTGINFTVSPTVSTTYTITGSTANGCSSVNNLFPNVIVGNTPIINISSSTGNSICRGQTAILTVSTASSYSWSTGSTSSSVSVNPVTTTVYTVMGTNAGICPGNLQTFTLTVNSSPTVTVNNASVCSGMIALLTATATPVAGTTYLWSTGSTGNPLTISPTANAIYTVTVTSNGCSSGAIASVSVTPVNVPVTGFSYPAPICTTDSNPLPTGISGFSSGGTFTSMPGLTVDSASGLIDLMTSVAGTYVVTYSVTANGCNPSGSSSFTVTLNAPMLAVTGFTYLSPICAKDSNPLPILASGFTMGGSFSGAGITINSTNGMIDLVNTPAGTYTVNYNVNPANCVQPGANSVAVTIFPNPGLSINSSTTIIVGEQTVLASNSSANTYTWFPSTFLSCVNCPKPTAYPRETTTYCVRTTDGVCTNSVCVDVNVESLCEGDKGIYLPNAFSPNGDGNNDLFCVQGTNRCITDFTLIIYDRWGEKIFESSDISFCWDGTYKGKALPPDAFVYYVRAKDQYKKEIIKKGNVTLIK